ncbi:hypothetical protein BY996DRAFT_8210360 [Phakopsora pachyrhizi]|nr:hypothetical protein BY996DRAFT_8210360 [Phakopsora pachyrhizi]
MDPVAEEDEEGAGGKTCTQLGGHDETSSEAIGSISPMVNPHTEEIASAFDKFSSTQSSKARNLRSQLSPLTISTQSTLVRNPSALSSSPKSSSYPSAACRSRTERRPPSLNENICESPLASSGLKPLALVSPANPCNSQGSHYLFRSSSLSPMSNSTPLSAASNGDTSGSSHSPSVLARFERRTGLTQRSAINSVESPISPSKLGLHAESCMEGRTSCLKKNVSRSRSSISYSKSSSPDRNPRNTLRQKPSTNAQIDPNVFNESPAASVCSSCKSTTSSFIELSAAREVWKTSLAQALKSNGDQPITLIQSQRSCFAMGTETNELSDVGGFGALVMDEPSNDDAKPESYDEGVCRDVTEENFEEDEDDVDRALLKSQILRGREENGRIRTESEEVRSKLEQKINNLEISLARAVDLQSSQSMELKIQRHESLRWKGKAEELLQEQLKLREEILGHKSRMRFLEDQVKQEKIKSVEIENDLKEKYMMANELLKKRDESDRIFKPNFYNPDSTESVLIETIAGVDDAQRDAEDMRRVQLKVINEMRDQIFALAAALEQERSSHNVTRAALEAAAMQIEVNEIDEEGPATAAFTDEEDNPLSPFLLTSYESRTLEDQEQSCLAPFKACLAATNDILPSTSSNNFDVSLTNEHMTPLKPSNGQLLCKKEPPVFEGIEGTTLVKGDGMIDSEDQISSHTIAERASISSNSSMKAHSRRKSFIRHWFFPKGPVHTSASTSSPEDHCFFFKPNSIGITYPALEPSEELMVPQPFFSGELQLDEEEYHLSKCGKMFSQEANPNVTMDALANDLSYRQLSEADERTDQAFKDFTPPRRSPARIDHVKLFKDARSTAGSHSKFSPSLISSSQSSSSNEMTSSFNSSAELCRSPTTFGSLDRNMKMKAGTSLTKQISLQNLKSWVGSYVGGVTGGDEKCTSSVSSVMSSTTSPPYSSASRQFSFTQPNQKGGLSRFIPSGERIRTEQMKKLANRIQDHRWEKRISPETRIGTLDCLELQPSCCCIDGTNNKMDQENSFISYTGKHKLIEI